MEPTVVDTGTGPPLRLLERELTPASRLSLLGVAAHRALLRGVGIDWGSGCGCLAIEAARAPGVDHVVGLERDPVSVELARENAALNDVAPTVATLLSVEIPSGSAGRILGEMLAPARQPSSAGAGRGPNGPLTETGTTN